MARGRVISEGAGPWCGVVLLLACSSAAPQPAVMAPAPAAPAAGLCRFSAPKTSLEEIEVSVPGARFRLGVQDVPSQIELIAADGTAHIQVQSPLAFSATLPRGLLQLRVAVATDFYGGRLRVGAGLDPTWLGVRGGAMLLSLERSLGLVLDEPLALPCSHVRLSDTTEMAEAPAQEHTDAKRIGMGWDSFPLYASPDGGDVVSFRYVGPVALVETRPGWWHIVVDWSDGSRLDGWTPEREPARSWDDRAGSVSGGGFALGMGGVVDGPILQKARLHAGASVAAAPAGSVWARAAHELEVEVVIMNAYGQDPHRADGWLQLVTVPGLLPPPSEFRFIGHAWVHRSELTLIEGDAGETHTSGG